MYWSCLQLTCYCRELVSEKKLKIILKDFTGFYVWDRIWYLAHPTPYIAKFTTKMTCIYKKWLVNNILMSLEENSLAFYLHTLHITQRWSIGLKGSRGFDSIMEIDSCFIDPLKRLSRILKFEQLSFSRCYGAVCLMYIATGFFNDWKYRATTVVEHGRSTEHRITRKAFGHFTDFFSPWQTNTSIFENELKYLEWKKIKKERKEQNVWSNLPPPSTHLTPILPHPAPIARKGGSSE